MTRTALAAIGLVALLYLQAAVERSIHDAMDEHAPTVAGKALAQNYALPASQDPADYIPRLQHPLVQGSGDKGWHCSWSDGRPVGCAAY